MAWKTLPPSHRVTTVYLYILPLIHACCSRRRRCQRLQCTHYFGRTSGSWGIGSSASLGGHPKGSAGPQPQLPDINALHRPAQGGVPSHLQCRASTLWSTLSVPTVASRWEGSCGPLATSCMALVTQKVEQRFQPFGHYCLRSCGGALQVFQLIFNSVFCLPLIHSPDLFMCLSARDLTNDAACDYCTHLHNLPFHSSFCFKSVYLFGFTTQLVGS